MDLPAAPIHLVVWRFTTVDNGALCVMTSGLPQTVVWLVVNLDLQVLPVQPVIVQAMLQGEILLVLLLCSAPLHNLYYTFDTKLHSWAELCCRVRFSTHYAPLHKLYCTCSILLLPWAEHHTNLPKRRVGTLSSVSAFS